MKELQDAIVQTFTQRVESGAIQTLVEQNVDKFIKETLSDALRSYGDFSKALQKKINDDLCSKLDRLSLEQYNSIILQEIKARLDDVYLKGAKKHLESMLDEMFQKPKEKYKLSEIVKLYREQHEESARENDIEKMSVHIDDSSSYLFFIYIDSEGDKMEHQCALRLVVDKDGLLTSAHEKDIYNKMKAIRADKQHMGAFDSLLFQIMVWGTKVEVDKRESEDLAYYPHRSY
jgi:hypothetical protein